MRRTLKLAVVVAACLALAACSSGTTTTAAAKSTPSPSASTATALQWASAMNGSIKSMQDTWKEDQDNLCDNGSKSFTCSILPEQFQLTSSTLVVSIQGADEPSSHAYIGPPPPELVALVAATQKDAQKVADDFAGDKFTDGWTLDMSLLLSDLDAWGPYLNA